MGDSAYFGHDHVRPTPQWVSDLLDGRSEGSVRILDITGSPGSGKTWQLRGIALAAERRGLPVLWSRCAEPGSDRPLRPFARVVDSPMLLAALARAPLDAARVLRGSFPDVFPGVAAQDPDGTAPEAAMLELLRLAAAERGLVLVIDDLHLADPATLAFMKLAADNRGASGLLVVTARRPRQTPRPLQTMLALAGDDGAVAGLALQDLTIEQTGRLLRAAPDDPRVAALHAAGQGNPLYILSLAEAPGAGTAYGQVFADGGVPEPLGSALTRETGALSEAEWLVAAAAAMLGDYVDVERLGTVAGCGPAVAATAVAGLVRRDLLRWDQQAGGVRFRHPLIRRFCYGRADPGWRIAAHQRTLALLRGLDAPPAVQAAHIEGAMVGTRREDIELLVRGAEEVATGDQALAIRWLRAAASRVERTRSGADDPLPVEVQLRLCRMLGLSGRPAESKRLLREVLPLVPARQRRLRIEAVTFCALMECWLGEHAEARHRLTAEIAALPPEPPAEAAALFIAAGLVAMLSDGDADRTYVERALSIAGRSGDRLFRMAALALWVLCDLGEDDVGAGRAALGEATSIMDGLADHELARYPDFVWILGGVEVLCGDTAAAQRHYRRALDLVVRTGHRYLVPTLLIGLGHTYRRAGQLERARSLADEAAERAERVGAAHVVSLAAVLRTLCDTWLAPPAGRRAGTGDGGAGALMPARGLWHFSGVYAVASAALAGGEPERCARLITTAAGADLSRVPLVRRPVLQELLARALLQTGATAEAAELARAARAVAERVGSPLALAYAQMAAAHLAEYRGEYAEAAAGYLDAAHCFAKAGERTDEIRALIAGAQSAARSGSTRLADTMLSTARKLARSSCSSRLEEAVADVQRHLGKATTDVPAPPLPAPAGMPAPLAALTVREREIVAFAGRGLRTKDIAAELVISPRTVEVHLGRIYRKLKVGSRTELVRLLALQGGLSRS